jgi:hypothetical protein
MLKVLAIAQVEDRTNLDEQILKQTVQPDRVVFYIDKEPARGINERRKRIADNHKKLQEIVRAYKPELVWQIEQDGIYPKDTLERLLMQYNKLNGADFGYISGIQVGRHGLYCLGAWVNFTSDTFESLDFTRKGIQEVEATGFYCLLMEREKWLSGTASWNGEPYGPDVTWGLSMPYRKYVDMDLQIGHKIKSGIIEPKHISTCNVRFFFRDGRWQFKQFD